MFDTSWVSRDPTWASPAGFADVWFKAAGRMQVEAVAFMTRRMLATMEFPQVVARCQSPQDIVAEQIKFWQVAQRQYMQSLERMSHSATDPVSTAPRVRDYIKVPAAPSSESVIRSQSQPNGASLSHAQPIELKKQKADTEAEVAEWLYKKSA